VGWRAGQAARDEIAPCAAPVTVTADPAKCSFRSTGNDINDGDPPRDRRRVTLYKNDGVTVKSCFDLKSKQTEICC
jgi:hypothetical protein